MRIFSHDDQPPIPEQPGERPVLTLGVFDGVHLGHRAIIGEVMRQARENGGPGLAITFSNHPRTALGRSAPPGICSLAERLERLAATGIPAVWVLPFTPEISRIPGRYFAEEYFRRRLRARAVVLGEGAVFGRDREGSARALMGWSRDGDWDISVTPVRALTTDAGTVISSTAIRLAVQKGSLGMAESLLGRKISVTGTVVRGQGRGRELGFPTLNLDPHHELRPPPGVYLTRALIDGQVRPSVTNIGRPPTEREIEAGLRDFLIETHLLDYNADLYGTVARVEFLAKTRTVMAFASAEELRKRVEADLAAAREWFAGNGE